MSVYPHKRNGEFTGKWVVEVNHLGRRAKGYAESRADAELLEAQYGHSLRASSNVANDAVRATFKRTKGRGLERRTWTFAEARSAAEGSGLWPSPRWEMQAIQMLRILEEVGGNVALDAIDIAWVLETREKLVDEREISPSTVNRYWAVLGKFLQWTVDRRFRSIKSLPKLQYAKEAKGRLRWITEAEETRLYELLPEQVGNLVAIAIRTGMRRGELLSMEPHQISPGRCNLWETKAGEGRMVPLLPEDEATLRWLVGGNMPSADGLRKAWDKARRTMRLSQDPHFVFHACRHTYATRAIEAGVHVRILQRLMGHKKVTTTERYMQVGDTMLEGALDVMFGERVPPRRSNRSRIKPKAKSPHTSPHSLVCWSFGARNGGNHRKNGSPGLIRTGGRPINSRMLYR